MHTFNGQPEYKWTRDGRMYWALRNALGQFVNRYGVNRSRLAAQRAAWRAYLDARRESADRATRGHLLSRSAWLSGVSVSRVFLPGASLRNASHELRDWFTTHGPTLSFREFCLQIGD